MSSVERRGRTKADLILIDSGRKKVEPPDDLRPEIAAVFKEVVASCDANHFHRGDIPMLISFATATCLARFYADHLNKDAGVFKQWTEAVKLQAALARSLRLTGRAEPTRKPLRGMFPLMRTRRGW